MDKHKKLRKIIERMIEEKEELKKNNLNDDYLQGEIAILKQIQMIIITIEMVERD